MINIGVGVLLLSMQHSRMVALHTKYNQDTLTDFLPQFKRLTSIGIDDFEIIVRWENSFDFCVPPADILLHLL